MLGDEVMPWTDSECVPCVLYVWSMITQTCSPCFLERALFVLLHFGGWMCQQHSLLPVFAVIVPALQLNAPGVEFQVHHLVSLRASYLPM